MKSRKANYRRFAGEILGLIGIVLVLSSALVWIFGESWVPQLSQEMTALRERPALRHATPNAALSTAPAGTPESVAAGSTTDSSSPARPSAPSTPPPTPAAALPPQTPRTTDAPPVSEDEAPLEHGGDLAISGVVLTDTGDPVPDLDVTASADRVFEDATQGARRAQEYHARTDDEGFYEFPQLFDGAYTLRTAPTPPYQTTSKRVRAGMEEVTLVVAEARSQKVQGLVKQADSGAPLAGVTVAAASHTTATDDAGKYSLAVPVAGIGQGPTLLRFSHPEYRDQQLAVPGSSRQADLSITLKDVALEAVQGRAKVSGLVESQDGGKPLAGMRVFLASAKGVGQKDTLTAQDGTFHFPAVPWGTYTLVVVPKTGYQDLTHPNLQVTEAGVEDLHLHLASLPTTTLTGQFVDPAGQPVRGLTLLLTSRTVRTFTEKAVTSDPSGYFSIHDVPAGELEFTSRSDPYLTITGLTLHEGMSAPVTLPVDWGLQTLTGQVVTAGELPVPGAEITLSWSQTAQGLTSRAIRHSTTDATGTFRFTQLGPGLHTLNVSAPGYTRTLVDHPVGPDQPTVQVTLAARAS